VLQGWCVSSRLEMRTCDASGAGVEGTSVRLYVDSAGAGGNRLWAAAAKDGAGCRKGHGAVVCMQGCGVSARRPLDGVCGVRDGSTGGIVAVYTCRHICRPLAVACVGRSLNAEW
jgi:hypothetical protein